MFTFFYGLNTERHFFWFDVMSSSQVESVHQIISLNQVRVTADWHFLTITQAAMKTIAFVSIFYWNPIKEKYLKRCT